MLFSLYIYIYIVWKGGGLGSWVLAPSLGFRDEGVSRSFSLARSLAFV